MSTFLDQAELNFSSDSAWLLNICLAIITYGVALGIRKEDFFRILKQPKGVLLGLLSQLLILPLITLGVVLIMKPDPGIAMGMFLIAACPGGNISNFFSSIASGNKALSVSLTAFSSSLALVFTPFNLSFWSSFYPPSSSLIRAIELNYWNVFETILVTLLIPLILGMLTLEYKPMLAQRIEKWVKKISMVILMIFIVMAFSANWEQFLTYIGVVFWIVLLHNSLAYLAGFIVGKIGKLDNKDTRTIVLETGIQNGGLALLLIFNFFDGMGAMALIAACWGIWDMISGVGVAYLFSKIKSENR